MLDGRHPGIGQGTVTMARRQRKNKKLPIVDNHWILWLLGLSTAVPAGILMPMAYGTDPFPLGVTIATCACCMGGGYIIRAIAHRLIDYDAAPSRPPRRPLRYQAHSDRHSHHNEVEVATMARRQRKKAKLPIVDNHWILLTLGLPTAVPAGILMPLAYGTDPFAIGATAATCAFCMGGGYIIRAIAHRLID